MTKVFISYSWTQKDWVRNRLVPALRAGGADVLYDERFRLGRDVYAEMDSLQDQAEHHVLCLSDEYLRSDPCKREMGRALALDPHGAGIALPLRLNGVNVPDDLKPRLYADFTVDTEAEPWAKLLAACDADLGIAGRAGSTRVTRWRPFFNAKSRNR